MNEATTQVLMRIARLVVVAIISVLIANGADLIGILPPEYQNVAALVLIPLLDGVAKAVGGPTRAMDKTVGRGAKLGASESPNFLSV